MNTGFVNHFDLSLTNGDCGAVRKTVRMCLLSIVRVLPVFESADKLFALGKSHGDGAKMKLRSRCLGHNLKILSSGLHKNYFCHSHI